MRVELGHLLLCSFKFHLPHIDLVLIPGQLPLYLVARGKPWRIDQRRPETGQTYPILLPDARIQDAIPLPVHQLPRQLLAGRVAVQQRLGAQALGKIFHGMKNVKCGVKIGQPIVNRADLLIGLATGQLRRDDVG